jgi:hypothetical protein
MAKRFPMADFSPPHVPPNDEWIAEANRRSDLLDSGECGGFPSVSSIGLMVTTYLLLPWLAMRDGRTAAGPLEAWREAFRSKEWFCWKSVKLTCAIL